MSKFASKVYQNVVGAAVRRAFLASCMIIAALAGSGCNSILGDDYRFVLFPPDSGTGIPDASAADAPSKNDAADASPKSDGGDASLGNDGATNDGPGNVDVRRDMSVP